MASKTTYWPTNLKLAKFNGDRSKLSPRQLIQVSSYESNMNLGNLHAHPIIRFGRKKKGMSGPRKLRMTFLCWYCQKKVTVIPRNTVTFRYCSTGHAAKHRAELGFAAEKMRKNHHFRKGKRARSLNSIPDRTCPNCLTKFSIKHLSPKEREKRKFCSLSCGQTFAWKSPTPKMLEGRKIAGKKSGDRRRGTKLSEESLKKLKEGFAKRRGVKLSEEICKKYSEAQKKRWAKVPTVERTKKFWRISKHTRILQQELNLPDEHIEYQIQIMRLTGKFQKGNIYFLYVDIAYPEVRLAIEIDGQSHLSNKQRGIDTWKEKQLENLGWSVLRFWNQEVDNDLITVKKKIRSTIFKLKRRITSSQITA